MTGADETDTRKARPARHGIYYIDQTERQVQGLKSMPSEGAALKEFNAQRRAPGKAVPLITAKK